MPTNSSGKPVLNKTDVQLFKKRLRKECPPSVDYDTGELRPTPIRYYTVGEYGTHTERPHYHSILFNVPNTMHHDLPKIWGNGHVYLGTVTPASIHYVTGYVINKHDDYQGREPPFALMSRKPGLGSDYLRTHTKWHREGMRNFSQVNGFKSRLPRYYKDRMFNEEERVQLSEYGIEQANEAFIKELTEIKKFCEDPYRAYAERMQFAHNQIRVIKHQKISSL